MVGYEVEQPGERSQVAEWQALVGAPVRPATSGGVVDNAHRELCFPSDVLRPLRQRHRPADVRRDALLPLEIPRQGIALGRDDPTPEIGAILLVDQHPHTRTQPRLLTCFLGRDARPALDALVDLARQAAARQPDRQDQQGDEPGEPPHRHDRPPPPRSSFAPWITTALERSRARSEEPTSELQSLMRISSAVFCLKKKKINPPDKPVHSTTST